MNVEQHLNEALLNLPKDQWTRVCLLHLIAAVRQMNEIQNMGAEVTLRIAQHLEAITPK